MKKLIFLLPFLSASLVYAELSVVATPQPTAAPAPALPEGEQRLRNGIVLLGTLCQYMAAVQNHETAEAAVPQMMRLRDELQQWTRSFNNLPPLSEPEVLVYEERYLPIIRKINKLIQTQADRLGSAEYYGSRTLPAVLVRLAQVGH